VGNQISTSQLTKWGIVDAERCLRNLRALAATLGPASLAGIRPHFDRMLPHLADSDMALNNLERFFASAGGREQVSALLAENGRGLEILLQVLSTSQFFSDLLVADPEFVGTLHGPLRPSPTRDELIAALRRDLQAAPDDAGILRAFRRLRQREHLRIGINDLVRDRPLEEITQDLSLVAEASLEVALETAVRTLESRFGRPYLPSGELSECVVLAFGKLGGSELNFSSDIDLMLVYDDEGQTRGKRSSIGADEFYVRTLAELIRLLSAHTDRGQAYRIDLRLRPEGRRGPTARSLASTLSYYDTLGRTWERQALIKVRPVAGSRALGEEFLRSVEGFVWRTYLSFAEINEIKAMKRRIESNAHHAGDGDRDVKTGRGGIRDVEFTTQFLQLLNGGDLPRVRERGTLAAMQALESAGCLNDPEYRALDNAYRFLRKTEHRLQILFDWQTHRLPERTEELRKLALRMGFVGLAAAKHGIAEDEPQPLSGKPIESSQSAIRNPQSAVGMLGPQRHSPLDEPPPSKSLQTRDLLFDPLEQFLHEFQEKTRLTRTILDHLLHQSFVGSDTDAEPESDLILDPDPDENAVSSTLGKYRFRDVQAAYRNLMQLAQEAGPFLSTRRCRHFLASIAPQLLRAVSVTPDPDLTLTNLEKVTASLGAKAVLWELFSFLPASLKLYVDLCSNSPFLSEMLVNNPGMIDDLLDSLILNQPRTLEEMRAEIRELCRGVEKLDVIEQILRSFQDKELLRIGVRDLLGKDNVRATTAALSDVAEALLAETAERQEAVVLSRHGMPMFTDGSGATQTCRHVLLALGKLGGREMSYHSDLDLVFIYEGDGHTESTHLHSTPEEVTHVDNYQYFAELAQRIIRALSQTGPLGRLYDVDMRLRPTGKSGSLALPLVEFQRYFDEGHAQIWERQSLMRARVVGGDANFGRAVMAEVHRAMNGIPWSPAIVDEVRAMRARLEATASSRSLKRCPGGLMDVEFLVQMLQIKYGRTHPAIVRTNVWESLDALRDIGVLSLPQHGALSDGYSFLRFAETRVRIVTNRPLNEYPEDPAELEKLARRIGFDDRSTSASAKFQSELSRHLTAIRTTFVELMSREQNR
jgi:[glutamine synthetase] adenylyltransferase / [glutamine synthetase]-adenylyl-L-tyrosine phosphorylase